MSSSMIFIIDCTTSVRLPLPWPQLEKIRHRKSTFTERLLTSRLTSTNLEAKNASKVKVTRSRNDQTKMATPMIYQGKVPQILPTTSLRHMRKIRIMLPVICARSRSHAVSGKQLRSRCKTRLFSNFYHFINVR